MSGYVYAIQSGDAVKIGFSGKPTTRIKNLQTGNPGRAELLGFVEATGQQERELHQLLGSARIKGEWFQRNHPLIVHFLSLLPPFREDASKRPRNDNFGVPASLVIARFGGDTTLARILGIHRTRVANWKVPPSKTRNGGTSGRIPQRYHTTILQLARQRGFAEITPEFLICAAGSAA